MKYQPPIKNSRKVNRLSIVLLLLTALWGCSDKGLVGDQNEEASSFEGKITYKVDFQLPPERQQAAAMLPDEEFVYVKNGKTRMERNLAMAAQMTVIHDPKKDSMVMLINAEGLGRGGPHRVPIKIDSVKSDIEYLEEKDTLSVLEITHRKDGIDTNKVERVCKKAILKNEMRGRKLEVPVSYTESIAGQPFRQFQGLKGFPLKFESSANGIEVKKVVKKIEKMKVSDSLFNDHPEGYTTRSLKEFQQMMGGAR